MRKLLKTAMSGGAMMVLLLASSAASANAFVLNTGRDGLMCEVVIPIGGFTTAVGDATLVMTDSGRFMFSCHAIVLETPPKKALRLSGIPGPILGSFCKVVITPKGNFNATCHN